MFSAEDPFEVLGVPRNASAAEIKRAFKRLALEHHPDRNPGDPQAAQCFARICSAFNEIADTESRDRLRWAREDRREPPTREPASDQTRHTPDADHDEEWRDLCPTPEEIASLDDPPHVRPKLVLGLILTGLVLLVVLVSIARERNSGKPSTSPDRHVEEFLRSMSSRYR